MARALELAALGPAHGPNPRVGCVLLSAEGQVVGEGYHRGAGTAHAEVDAIADAVRRRAGRALRGATAVVTLEPCSHTGRTLPCTRALLAAASPASWSAPRTPTRSRRAAPRCSGQLVRRSSRVSWPGGPRR
jgi:pyrimidine deaminase RibD-like protein